MSGGRRKSRKPQKYEETGDLEDYENDVIGDTSDKSANQDKLSVGDPMNQDVTDNIGLFKDSESSRSILQNGTEAKHGETAKSSDAEITTLGILSGHRQLFISECKICCIQLKDWKETYSHLLHHRSNNLPPCYQKSSNAKRFDCLQCDFKVGNLKEIVYHALSEHNISKNPMHCSFCSENFESLGDVYQHMDMKCIEMKCPICSLISNQEYEFYAHLSGCLGTFHPNITSLKCHICNNSINLKDLARHMIEHSIVDSTQFEEDDILPETPPRPPSIVVLDTEMFLCDACDVRFDTEDSFIEHGEKQHVETKHICSLCYMRGFSNPYLLVRHMILRCTQRSIRQMKFGEELINFGKARGKGFLSTLKTSEGQHMLKRGLRAWRAHLIVMQFLDAFCSASHEELRNFHTESSSDEFPTDLELVAATTLYETNSYKNQFLLNRQQVNIDPKIIPQLFRGVTLVPNVDLARLRRVYGEAMKDVPHLNNSALKPGSFANSKKLHVERRLEMEAQYLRQMEPFYIQQKFYEENKSECFKIEEERYLRLLSDASDIKFEKAAKSGSGDVEFEVRQEDIKRLKEDAFNLVR